MYGLILFENVTPKRSLINSWLFILFVYCLNMENAIIVPCFWELTEPLHLFFTGEKSFEIIKSSKREISMSHQKLEENRLRRRENVFDPGAGRK